MDTILFDRLPAGAAAGAGGGLMAEQAGRQVAAQPRGAVSVAMQEAIQLFCAVETLRSGDQPIVVQFMGVAGGEGASTVAANFAAAAGQASNASVLLLDCGPEQADHAMTALVDLPPEQWQARHFARAVAGAPHVFRARLTHGRDAALPLDGAALAALFTALRAQFQVIVLDTPPLARFLHLAGLVRQADGTIFVTAFAKTRAKEVLAARRDVESYGGQVIGSVMNRIRPVLPRWLPRWLAERL